MRALVIGKAKTGTTALAILINRAIHAKNIVMEPKSCSELKKLMPAGSEPNCTKIIFEHFIERLDELKYILDSNPFGFDKVIFIKRDIRDEMVSRLLYIIKPLIERGLTTEQVSKWIDVLRAKEMDPSKISFSQLCSHLEDISGNPIWERVCEYPAKIGGMYDNFIKHEIERDNFVLDFDALVDGNVAPLFSYIGAPQIKMVSKKDMGNLDFVFRSARSGSWRDVFLDPDKIIIQDILEFHKQNRPDWDWDLNYAKNLIAEEYSGYIKRIAFHAEHGV